MILIDLRGACDTQIISRISKHLPVNKNKRRLLFKPIENTLSLCPADFTEIRRTIQYPTVVRNDKRIKRYFTSVQTSRRIIFITDNVRLFVFRVDFVLERKTSTKSSWNQT